MSRQPPQGPSGGYTNLPMRPFRKEGIAGGHHSGGGEGRGPQTCYTCGRLGHIQKNCPQSASADLAKKCEKEDELVKMFEGVNRTGMSKPYRPSYGTKGNPVGFQTNYFELNLPDKLVLYRYRITIDPDYSDGKQLPEPNNNELKQIINIMLILSQKYHQGPPKATDFKSTLISAGRIPQRALVTKVRYFNDENGIPEKESRKYTLRIEETPPHLTISALKESLASTNTVAPFRDRELMLQALNIVFGHHAKSSPTITVIEGNKAYPSGNDPPKENSPLTTGLEAIRGYFLSVRLASFRAIVNVNVSHRAFYEAIALSTLMYDWFAKLPVETMSQWVALEALLKGVKVRTRYMRDQNRNPVTQVRSIKGFASQSDGEGTNRPPHVDIFAASPREVWFYLDDNRDFTKQRFKLFDRHNNVKEKYISVDEYFMNKYEFASNKHTTYPVVNFGSRRDPIYVPAEACVVEPGQRAKLTPNQTDRMINFAVRKPSDNSASINANGLSVLGLSPIAANLRRFDIEINEKMMTVYGRMLNRPVVRYKGGTPAREAPGGWNLRDVEFQKAVPSTNNRLDKWGCLTLCGSGYDSAILDFTNSLRSCGIETRDPRIRECSFDQRRGDFFDKERGVSLEYNIRQMHRHQKMTILLIILPTKDKTLYNRIKMYCDQTEGIHAVCVVGDQFAKRQASYFANLALKFNLKLGGINHTLNEVEIGIISKSRTMVAGINVVHPLSGSGRASVASMVASIDRDLAQWPVDLQAQVREGREMLDKVDTMLGSRLALWRRQHDSYPENILIYRDGISESQHQQVLDEELRRMQEVCQVLYNKIDKPLPRFTLIAVGKQHHTRFFPPTGHPRCDDHGYPERGLVVDRDITEARNWDFFLQSHDAIRGTARPAHYYVLYDEIFTNADLKSVHDSIEPGIPPADWVERLSHSLCYMFSRATKAVSIPAPVYYADIACTRAGRYLATGSQPATSDSAKLTAAQREKICADLQARIKVHDALRDSMFYI